MVTNKSFIIDFFTFIVIFLSFIVDFLSFVFIFLSFIVDFLSFVFIFLSFIVIFFAIFDGGGAYFFTVEIVCFQLFYILSMLKKIISGLSNDVVSVTSCKGDVS